ncbi:MAG: TlpA disulfide reductase family protein [Agriterribacter sp.]
MRKTLIIIYTFFFALSIHAQTVDEIVAKVKQAQQQLKTVAYTLHRVDTFVTGDTRETTGQIKLQVVNNDSVFGCWFWGKRDDVDIATIYDGKKSISLDNQKKQYNVNMDASMFPHLLGAAGGQMLLTDLVKLDTSNNTGLSLKQDDQYYYLTKHIPDLEKYDVYNRYAVYTIDKQRMLPIAMRSHQETSGKVQDLNYMIKDIWINDAAHAYDFNGQYFPDGYTQGVESAPKPFQFLNKPAPDFQLVSLKNEPVQLKKLKGKVVLLDFLEVWCGPCFASVPKVQDLSDKYKSKGLEVYGVSFEKKQADVMKRMIEKFKLSFPVLMGDEPTRKIYEVNAIPRYILVNRKGDVVYSHAGFSNDMEKEIEKVLSE